jgi:DNA polymerase III subunit delta'
MQFDKIIGQESVKTHLVQMAQHNRLSHALLFLGKEGVGGLSLAIAFAQFVVCERNSPFATHKPATAPDMFGGASLFGAEPVVEATPMSNELPIDSCGVCPSCQKVQQGAHPDVHFSYPVITRKSGEKPVSADFIKEWREFVQLNPYGNVYDWLQFIGAENKQGNITAEECNDINRKISLKSFESTHKVLIIWMPEYLTKNGNRLLKLIEEPPDNTLFILVAENDELVLPTILSRTQLIKIPALTDQEVIDALIARANLAPDKAAQIAMLSEGNYREAQHLLQHAEDDWQVVLREWLNMIVKRNLGGQLKWIEDMSKNGRENQKQFLRYFSQLLEQAIRIQSIPNLKYTQTSDTDFAIRLNKLCSVFQQEAIVQELDKASYYIERNANGKMLFHALSIRLYHIICNNSLILVN